jgi:hypothetical protein
MRRAILRIRLDAGYVLCTEGFGVSALESAVLGMGKVTQISVEKGHR